MKIFFVSEALLHSDYMLVNIHNENIEILFRTDLFLEEPRFNNEIIEFKDYEFRNYYWLYEEQDYSAFY